MLRMETMSLPGRMLPITLPAFENGNGHSENNENSIKLEHASDKTKCNCWIFSTPSYFGYSKWSDVSIN